MLPKKQRVGRKLIDQIFLSGRFINSPSLSFKFLYNKESKNAQVSFVAPKSVAKLAVKRNALRRKSYRVLAKYINHFPSNLVGVFVYKKYLEDIKTIEDEIKSIVSKIN